MFQFTHPQGVRFFSTSDNIARRVSIHAPARGAIGFTFTKPILAGFNSRTRKGCDQSLPCKAFLFPVSIHAPARGAINSPRVRTSQACFNSRTRKGCDYSVAAISKHRRFQFTHPQGVRLFSSSHFKA